MSEWGANRFRPANGGQIDWVQRMSLAAGANNGNNGGRAHPPLGFGNTGYNTTAGTGGPYDGSHASIEADVQEGRQSQFNNASDGSIQTGAPYLPANLSSLTDNSGLDNSQTLRPTPQRPLGFNQSQFSGPSSFTHAPADTQLDFDYLGRVIDNDSNLVNPYEQVDEEDLQQEQLPPETSQPPSHPRGFDGDFVRTDHSIQGFEDADNSIQALREQAAKSQQEADRLQQRLQNALSRPRQSSQGQVPPPPARPRQKEYRDPGVFTSSGSQLPTPGYGPDVLLQYQPSQGYAQQPAQPLQQSLHGGPTSQNPTPRYAVGRQGQAIQSLSNTPGSHPQLLRPGNSATQAHLQPSSKALGKRRASDWDDEHTERGGNEELDRQRAHKRINTGQPRRPIQTPRNGYFSQTSIDRNRPAGVEGYLQAPSVADRPSRPARRRAAPAEIEAFRDSQRQEALARNARLANRGHAADAISSMPFNSVSSSSALQTPDETPTHRAYKTRSHRERGTEQDQPISMPSPPRPQGNPSNTRHESHLGKRSRDTKEGIDLTEENVKPVTKRQRKLQEAEKKGVKMGSDNKKMGIVEFDANGNMTTILNGNQTPAVYHHERRTRLLEIEDAKGEYTYPPTSGEDPDDRTAFHPDYKDVNIKHREARPEILYQWDPPAKNPLINEPPFMYDPDDTTRILLDANNHPIKDWPELPKVISGQVEGLYIEYWRRHNRHISIADVVARCPKTSSKGYNTKKHNLSLAAFSNRSRRERVKIGVHASEAREGTNNIINRLKEIMPARIRRDIELTNSVKNWRDFKNEEVDAILAVNRSQGSANARAGNKALGRKEKEEREKRANEKTRKVMEALIKERDADDAKYGFSRPRPGNGNAAVNGPADRQSRTVPASSRGNVGPASPYSGAFATSAFGNLESPAIHPTEYSNTGSHGVDNLETGATHLEPLNDSGFDDSTFLNTVIDEGSTLVEEEERTQQHASSHLSDVDKFPKQEDHEDSSQHIPQEISCAAKQTSHPFSHLQFKVPVTLEEKGFVATALQNIYEQCQKHTGQRPPAVPADLPYADQVIELQRWLQQYYANHRPGLVPPTLNAKLDDGMQQDARGSVPQKATYIDLDADSDKDDQSRPAASEPQGFDGALNPGDFSQDFGQFCNDDPFVREQLLRDATTSAAGAVPDALNNQIQGPSQNTVKTTSATQADRPLDSATHSLIPSTTRPSRTTPSSSAARPSVPSTQPSNPPAQCPQPNNPSTPPQAEIEDSPPLYDVADYSVAAPTDLIPLGEPDTLPQSSEGENTEPIVEEKILTMANGGGEADKNTTHGGTAATNVTMGTEVRDFANVGQSSNQAEDLGDEDDELFASTQRAEAMTDEQLDDFFGSSSC
ncbi:MAG: hypothetical protein Q9222_002737 [Ikaeria aurantiellina]